MNVSVRQLFVLLLSLCLVASACANDENQGDLAAFCELVEDGVGITSATQALQASDFEQLAAVAPPEVRDVVQRLGNTTKNLEELQAEASLEEFFNASFDPSAVKAQEDFVGFATKECSVNVEAIAAGPTPAGADLVSLLRTYIDQNFSSQSWVEKVRFDLLERGLRGDSIQVAFIISPVGDEPTSACEIVSAYLYDVAGETGSVQVLDGKVVVVERTGPQAACANP